MAGVPAASFFPSSCPGSAACSQPELAVPSPPPASGGGAYPSLPLEGSVWPQEAPFGTSRLQCGRSLVTAAVAAPAPSPKQLLPAAGAVVPKSALRPPCPWARSTSTQGTESHRLRNTTANSHRAQLAEGGGRHTWDRWRVCRGAGPGPGGGARPRPRRPRAQLPCPQVHPEPAAAGREEVRRARLPAHRLRRALHGLLWPWLRSPYPRPLRPSFQRPHWPLDQPGEPHALQPWGKTTAEGRRGETAVDMTRVPRWPGLGWPGPEVALWRSTVPQLRPQQGFLVK